MLQELTALRPAGERPFLVGAATARFRRAIRLRPEFDRACYNLGTVFYSHAVVLQNEAEGSASGSSDASQVGTLHMTSSLLACRTQRIRICGVIWLLLCVEQTNQRKAGQLVSTAGWDQQVGSGSRSVVLLVAEVGRICQPPTSLQ